MFDPVKGTDFMRLLSVESTDLDSSILYQKFKDIYDYFDGRADAKWQMLKILNKRPNAEKLETVWNWVQLQQEKRRILASFKPEFFTEDINEQIKNEYLTKENIKLLQEQTRKRELEARMRDSKKKIEKTALTEKEEQEVNSVAPANVFKDMRASLEALEVVNDQLSEYA